MAVAGPRKELGADLDFKMATAKVMQISNTLRDNMRWSTMARGGLAPINFRPTSEIKRTAHDDWLENDFNDERLIA
jgi:hypothetical protein